MQDLLREEAAELYKMIVLDKGHFYVCGDVTMADHVYQTLKTIMQTYGNMTDEQVEKFMLSMRVSSRRSFYYIKNVKFPIYFTG